MSTSFQSPRLRTIDKPVAKSARDRLRVLIVHDGNPTLGTFDTAFQSAGYVLFPVSDKEAVQTFQFLRPDLIVLELDYWAAIQVLRRLRESTTIPIVVISGCHAESEQIACLDAGADDYVTKPFTIGALLARLRAALRRAFGVPRNEVFKTGSLTVDFGRRAVFVRDEEVRLTATEYALLKALASHAGMVKTHYQLIHEVWGTVQYQDAVHLLRVTVSNLRRKLVSDSRRIPQIVTEASIGYSLRCDSDRTRELRLETSVRRNTRVTEIAPNLMNAARMRNGECSTL
jgi:two-component system KDP operon response regulator KdpE